MDETLSVYVIKIKGSSYYTLAHFFLNSTHGFGLNWEEQQFEGDMMGGREKVFTYAAFFVSSTGVKIDTNGCVGD